MSLTREEVFALIDETIYNNNSKQIEASEVNALLKAIYDNAPNTGFEHYIGEAFGGGVIFHLWKDSEGVEHGLVVDTQNISTSQAWSNVSSTNIGAAAQSLTNGLANSSAIIAQSGHITSAAKLCLDSISNEMNDWYLPAIEEIFKLRINLYEVSQGLSAISGTGFGTSTYWTSTEVSTSAYRLDFGTFGINSSPKGFTHAVRAIRQF